jgi:hypothetical protein
MIHRKTVFVLGAGASMPYGFPSGDQLIDEIVQIASPRENLPPIFDIAGFDYGQVLSFGVDLAYSDMPSIDSFLEHRPEFLRIGKLAITLALVGRELDHTLSRSYRLDPNNTLSRRAWYDYLWREMLAPRDQFGDNNVAFVTFNYDRSLERYFSLRLQAQHGHSCSSEVLKDLYRIPFIHIYGSLGDEEFIVYPYCGDRKDHELIKIADELKIIHEDDPSGNPNFPAAIQLLRQAERVCFLGYGFHELNNNGLDLSELAMKNASKKQQWFASRFNMTDVEFKRRTYGFYPRFVDRTGQTKIYVGDESDGALEVLRKLPVI